MNIKRKLNYNINPLGNYELEQVESYNFQHGCTDIILQSIKL